MYPFNLNLLKAMRSSGPDFKELGYIILYVHQYLQIGVIECTIHFLNKKREYIRNYDVSTYVLNNITNHLIKINCFEDVKSVKLLHTFSPKLLQKLKDFNIIVGYQNNYESFDYSLSSLEYIHNILDKDDVKVHKTWLSNNTRSLNGLKLFWKRRYDSDVQVEYSYISHFPPRW
jgi:hypothetical protein